MWCLVPVQPIANLVGPLDLGLNLLALVIVLRIFHCKIFMNLYEWLENSLWRTHWRAFFMWIRLMQFRFFVRICTGWCFTLSSISLGSLSPLLNGEKKTFIVGVLTPFKGSNPRAVRGPTLAPFIFPLLVSFLAHLGRVRFLAGQLWPHSWAGSCGEAVGGTSKNASFTLKTNLKKLILFDEKQTSGRTAFV